MKLDFTHNTKLKAMALLLAVLTWGIVKQITNNDKPVLVEDVDLILPDGWALREKDTEFYVTFRGTREDLLLLDEETVEMRVDLREAEFESEKVIELLPRHVTFTGSIARIIDIYPATLTVRLGREGSKQLPVVVNRVGEPPEGFKLEGMTATPQMVTLYGAEDLLNEVNSLQTARLDVSDKTKSFDQRLDVLPPSEDWAGRMDPPRIRVKVTLVGLTVERTFSDIPLLLFHGAGEAQPPAWRPDPETVDVFLIGSPQRLDELEASEIQAFVSASTSDGNASPLRDVHVRVPDGLNVIGVKPDRIRLRPPLPTPTPDPTSTPTPKPAPAPETP